MWRVAPFPESRRSSPSSATRAIRGWRERFTEPEALTREISAVEILKHRLKNRAGRATYALCKQTVEPVFGLIKSVVGFRQFLLRGLGKVRNEWTLVCLA